MPQNSARGICQTLDGYLWIATLDGLVRFDGVRFMVFDKSNTPAITSNLFNSMYQSKNGDLWLDTDGGALTRYHNRSFRSYYGAAQGIPSNTVRGLAGDDAGHLWILSGEDIAQWDAAAERFVDITPKGTKIHYIPLLWDSSGFWGSDKASLRCFIKGHFVTYPLPQGFPGDSIWGAAHDQRGTLWLEALNGRQASIDPGSLASRLVDLRHPPYITYFGRTGHSWLMHIGHRLTRSVDYLTSGRAATVSLTRFYEDGQENLWLGTEGQGLYRLQRQSISVYSKERGLIDRDVYPIYQDRSGAVWIGAWQTGLSRLEGGRFTNFTVADGLSARLVTALFEDLEGHLWVGTHGGLNIYKRGRFQKAAAPILPDRAVVQAICQDREHTLWFGTNRGLLRFKNGVTQRFTTEDGLATNDVHVILEGAQGDLWLGGYGGLTRLRNAQFTHWTERDGLPSNNIWSIYEDKDRIVWIGTYDGGLGRFQNGKFTHYGVREGLFNNGVFQILEDAHDNLWISCNHGIYRVNRRELNEYAAGSRNTITSIAYGKIDGMRDVECNGGLQPAGIKTLDRKMLFPTQDGVAVVDPEAIPSDQEQPPVMIESAMIDRVPVVIADAVEIAPGKTNLEIQYTAPSFIKPEQHRFKYRLEGLESKWIDAGARRTAYYSHIPPGKYVFKVIAGNSDGIWNTEGKSLTITSLAPFYKRGWFAVLVILGVAALVTSAWRYRVSQLNERQVIQQAFSQQLIASQERERKRIAAELHDSLGQRLVVINNLALLSLRASGKAAQADRGMLTLEEISSEAISAMRETRDISYDLRPFQLDRFGLSKAISTVIRTVSAASGISITSELDDIDDLFPEDLRINFYRIVQESLSNIMKHAGATAIDVRIRRTDEHMVLTIQDNGKGFVPERQVPQSGRSHGLPPERQCGRRNLFQRASRVRGANVRQSGDDSTLAAKPQAKKRSRRK